MSEFIKVTPKEGFRVLHPEFPYTAIPEEGMRVRKSLYYTRMEKQGALQIEEIEEGDKPATPKADEATKASPKKGVNDAV